jgi:regulatory protein
LKLSQEIAFEKTKRYCAYQDRCHQEVRQKIISLKIYGDDLEEIMTELIKQDFLNEERYARSFARGKFRVKKWGRNKIKQQLYARRISDYCIRKAMTEIEEEDYIDTLREVIDKKVNQLEDQPKLIRKDKAIKYALSRGYESNLIFKIVKELEEDEGY